MEHFSPEKEEDDLDESEMVEEKIRQLTEEVSRQQIVISQVFTYLNIIISKQLTGFNINFTFQSSQALNLCEATIEFCGSSEQVDGEKHLLVASK